MQNRPSIATAARRRLAWRPLVEPVEPRRLLSTSLNGGVLQITGDSSSETYAVTLDGSDLVVSRNGAAGQHFAKASVTRIDASLGNGDDSLTIDFAIDTPASLNGEAGSDTLVGGSGRDTLDGGSGNDTLDGGGQDETGDGSADGDQGDVVTYASRATPVTATLTLRLETGFDEATGTPSGPTAGTGSGSGGSSGETDSYRNVETIVGGSGNDTLTLLGNTQELHQPAPREYALSASGGGGNDTIQVASGYTRDHDPIAFLANGDAGNDSLDFSENRDPFLPATLNGGDGDDTFVGRTDDGFYSAIDGGAGTDLLTSESELPIAWTIPAGVENLAVRSATRVTGNALDNSILFGSSRGVTTVTGGNGNDTIQGSGFADTIDGGPGNDVILGGGGDDCLTGGSGNDQIDPGTGNDSVDGGDGGDAITYEGRSAAVTGTISATLVGTGSGASVTRSVTASLTDNGVAETDTGTNIEALTGSDANDTLSAVVNDADWDAAPSSIDRSPIIVNGVKGNDTLRVTGVVRNSRVADTPSVVANGGDGDDTLTAARTDASHGFLNGEAGDDVLVYDDPIGFAAMTGGAGADQIRVNRPAGGDALAFTMADDVEDADVTSAARVDLTGNDAANVISVAAPQSSVHALGGDDRIYGSDGDDSLFGMDGRDKVWGRGGDDRIDGGNGNDVLRGEDGDDKVYGRDGNDNLDGGEGRDSLYGGDNDDLLNGGGGRDIVYGNAGTDTGYKQSIDRIFKQIELLA